MSYSIWYLRIYFFVMDYTGNTAFIDIFIFVLSQKTADFYCFGETDATYSDSIDI